MPNTDYQVCYFYFFLFSQFTLIFFWCPDYLKKNKTHILKKNIMQSLKIKGSQLLVISVLLMVCVSRASFYPFVSRIKGGIYICNDIFVRVIRVSEEREP